MSNARFDWYQTTVQATDPQASGLVSVLLDAWPLSDWVPAKNLNGYAYGGAVVRGDRTLCHVCWGGQPGINCKTTSDESPVLARALRVAGVEHAPTRVDACMDWVDPGMFTVVAGALIDFAQRRKLAIDQHGDWVRGEARSLYLGSKDSPVRLVMYEKGYEQGGDAPRDWVRLEVRIRPKRQSRDMVAAMSADDLFAVGWVRDALEGLGWADLSARAVVGTVWRASDAERARAALLKQYAGVMRAWADEVGGWDQMGLAVEAALKGQSTGAGSRSELVRACAVGVPGGGAAQQV